MWKGGVGHIQKLSNVTSFLHEKTGLVNQTRRNINMWILDCIHMYIVGMFHN